MHSQSGPAETTDFMVGSPSTLRIANSRLAEPRAASRHQPNATCATRHRGGKPCRAFVVHTPARYGNNGRRRCSRRRYTVPHPPVSCIVDCLPTHPPRRCHGMNRGVSGWHVRNASTSWVRRPGAILAVSTRSHLPHALSSCLPLSPPPRESARCPTHPRWRVKGIRHSIACV